MAVAVTVTVSSIAMAVTIAIDAVSSGALALTELTLAQAHSPRVDIVATEASPASAIRPESASSLEEEDSIVTGGGLGNALVLFASISGVGTSEEGPQRPVHNLAPGRVWLFLLGQRWIELDDVANFILPNSPVSVDVMEGNVGAVVRDNNGIGFSHTSPKSQASVHVAAEIAMLQFKGSDLLRIIEGNPHTVVSFRISEIRLRH